jgi:hypothetical protein
MDPHEGEPPAPWVRALFYSPSNTHPLMVFGQHRGIVQVGYQSQTSQGTRLRDRTWMAGFMNTSSITANVYPREENEQSHRDANDSMSAILAFASLLGVKSCPS